MHVAVLEACLVYCAAEICGERIHQSTQRFRRKLLGTDLHEQVGGLRFDDYIALSIQLGTVRNVFAFYDRQRQGSVTFNFDTFFTAVLTCS